MRGKRQNQFNISYGVDWDIAHFINMILCDDLRITTEWMDYIEALKTLKLSKEYSAKHKKNIT